MAKRLAVVDNSKLKDMQLKEHIKNLCPVNRSGTECIEIREDNKLYISEETCIGCGICVKPAPEAIHIINLPDALTKPPIHRYGENAFSLYSVPIPIMGKVVGLLGVNGIGKSSAIKILAGIQKPNMGNLEKEANWDDLIQFYKGTEAQSYFEKVRDGQIKVAYKPQQIELIPKAAKGTVKEMLQKVDEKGEIDLITEKLELSHIINRDLEQLSGGEMQRVAIAATVLKKANLYVFDEPTSFLDIKQRVKISKFIRELADENTAVLVVEHDLIILDYMTDLIHVLYGKEGVYGVVSQPLSTRVGINAFLDGFLKEDNMRFRNHKINFDKGQAFASHEKEVVTSWTNISKKQGDFTLTAPEGQVHKKEVIGVLGENGIGKTSFVKILAGVIKSDTGELDEEIKVSYKPQYLNSDNEELVMSYLHKAIEHYTGQLIQPLNIEPLMAKQLNQLSGGELQRVSICKALSTEADMYLLDEPSAYLDVEQRLSISKVIKNFMDVRGKTGIIVDHDLLFVDYLSDTLLVFDGQPAVSGTAKGPFSLREGMNLFLKDLKLTFRRDPESKRPRANKPGSQLDEKQIREKNLYYV